MSSSIYWNRAYPLRTCTGRYRRCRKGFKGKRCNGRKDCGYDCQVHGKRRKRCFSSGPQWLYTICQESFGTGDAGSQRRPVPSGGNRTFINGYIKGWKLCSIPYYFHLGCFHAKDLYPAEFRHWKRQSGGREK